MLFCLISDNKTQVLLENREKDISSTWILCLQKNIVLIVAMCTFKNGLSNNMFVDFNSCGRLGVFMIVMGYFLTHLLVFPKERL